MVLSVRSNHHALSIKNMNLFLSRTSSTTSIPVLAIKRVIQNVDPEDWQMNLIVDGKAM